MVIRRFRDHVAKQNWFAVGIDVAIVVVGVFLGMQANNWNAARVERAAAADYRAEIIDNLRANEISIRDQLTYYRQVNEHALAALAVLEDPAAESGEPFIIDAYQASQIRQRQLTGTAYEELRNAGIGRSIADAKTRSLLSSYYAQLPQINDTALTITTFRDRVRSAIPVVIQRRIRQQCGDVMLDLPGGVVGSALPKDCRLGLSTAELDRAVERLRRLPGLELDLTRRIADVDGRIGALQVLLDRAEAARKALETYRD